jgi:hypothetical protein
LRKEFYHALPDLGDYVSSYSWDSNHEYYHNIKYSTSVSFEIRKYYSSNLVRPNGFHLGVSMEYFKVKDNLWAVSKNFMNERTDFVNLNYGALTMSCVVGYQICFLKLLAIDFNIFPGYVIASGSNANFGGIKINASASAGINF